MLNLKYEKEIKLQTAARIKEAIASQPRGFKAKLAKACDVSNTAITGWEKNGSIDKTNLAIVAKMTGYSLNWLVTGRGEKLYGPNKESVPAESAGYTLGEFDLWDGTTPLRDDEVALPFFREVELAAGSGRGEVIENHGMKLRFAKSTLRNQGVLECNAACATVSGTSMEPMLRHGSAIGIDKGTTHIIDGEIYAIDHDGSLRVKYLYKMPGGGMRIRSENREEYPDETLSHEEAKRVRVIGWIFWWSTLPKRRQ
ncbi:MAG: LexA family transcriptional regulator [Methylobacter sp.]